MVDDPFIHIQPVDAEVLKYLVPAAKEDGHNVMCPSDVLTKNGQILGYVGIGTVPVLTMWMDTRKAKFRDTLTALAFAEGLMARNHISHYLLPCETASPFYPLLQKAETGFSLTNYDKLFLKKI